MKSLLVFNGIDKDGKPVFKKTPVGDKEGQVNLKKAQLLLRVNPFKIHQFNENGITGMYANGDDYEQKTASAETKTRTAKTSKKSTAKTSAKSTAKAGDAARAGDSDPAKTTEPAKADEGTLEGDFE